MHIIAETVLLSKHLRLTRSKVKENIWFCRQIVHEAQNRRIEKISKWKLYWDENGTHFYQGFAYVYGIFEQDNILVLKLSIKNSV